MRFKQPYLDCVNLSKQDKLFLQASLSLYVDEENQQARKGR